MKRQEETPLVCPYNLSSSGARTYQPYLPDHPERLGLAAVCFAELLSGPWHVSKPRLACAASQGAAHTPVQTLPCTRQSSFAVQKVHSPDGLCTCGRVQTGAGQRMPGSHGMDRGYASGLRLGDQVQHQCSLRSWWLQSRKHQEPHHPVAGLDTGTRSSHAIHLHRLVCRTVPGSTGHTAS